MNSNLSKMISSRKSCAIEAHAKINLSLEILGTRPDGYHDLRSVVMPIALHDDLWVEVSPSSNSEHSISIEIIPDGVDCSKIGDDKKNLCVKAANLFLSRVSGISADVFIRITKRIPLGGGMGGGSADAAATLIALNHLFSPTLFSQDELISMAAEIGSDVPALLLGGTVLMEGRGEKVSRLNDFAPPFDILLANPGTHISTPAAFKAYDEMVLTKSQISSNIVHSRNCGGALSDFATSLSNGLEKPVFALYPEVARTAAALKEAGAIGVLMSGSGATVFALAESPEAAGNLAGALPDNCWKMISRTVPDGVMAAHGPLEA